MKPLPELLAFAEVTTAPYYRPGSHRFSIQIYQEPREPMVNRGRRVPGVRSCYLGGEERARKADGSTTVVSRSVALDICVYLLNSIEIGIFYNGHLSSAASKDTVLRRGPL